ncbi:MAG: CoA transferase [Dehalococcoidia bacterium]|nr:CoA transferase [Dehalococcoidia bacterium]
MPPPLLEGIRVIDLGRYIAAPFVGQLLADLGADVVRVERTTAEPDRLRGPYLDGRSLYFVALNHSKRSVAFDVFSAEGRAVLDELIDHADILIENFSPAVAANLGLTRERLRARNPRLIALGITAYGPDGPDAERVGFDGLAQARTGAMASNGVQGDPYVNHLPYVDFSTALFGAFGLMAALYERERTGEGQFIDASLFETAGAMIAAYGMIAEAALTPAARAHQGNTLAFALGDRVRSRDGDFILFNIIGNMFTRLCVMVERPEWVDDPRFVDDPARFAHRDELFAHVASWAAARTTAEVLRAAQEHQLPFERVGSVRDLATDAHAAARGMFPRVAQPGIGAVPVARLGLTMSGHPHEAPRPAPTIGEHTSEVLAQWLGWDAVRVAGLPQSRGAR